MARPAPLITTRRNRSAGGSEFRSVEEISLLAHTSAGSDRGEERLRRLCVHSAWGRTVGSHLRRVARPLSYRSSHLVVEVRDSAWKRELERLRPEILLRLAQLWPSEPVRKLSFRLRTESPYEPSVRSSPDQPVSPGTVKTPGRGNGPRVPLEDVSEGSLSDRFKQVMGRYLSGWGR